MRRYPPTTFLDIILLIHILPMRFVSSSYVREWPFIGWIGRAVDTVFVDRDDKSSRQATRETLAAISHYPPIALFPEGGIWGMGKPLHPFRYGAFEIVAAGSVPFLPCVLLYEPLETIYWGDESFWTAVWRLAKFKGPVKAQVVALRTVHPHPDESAKQLAVETHGAMEAVLTYAGQEDVVIQSGI
ncbi:MAG: lysophospholipid acyltransferase family protein [Anaerolineae bacterium]